MFKKARKSAVAVPKVGSAGPAINGRPNKAASPEEQEISDWLSSVHFRHQAVGGLDERDVWKKISELDALYAKALEAERLRCGAMVAHWQKIVRQLRAASGQSYHAGPSASNSSAFHR